MENKFRCFGSGSSIYEEYHDLEWGREVRDDNKLFEMLILEGMQAGLSWITILKKREYYREAFDNFDSKKIALYNDEKIKELMENKNIIRNKLKINAIINNAKIFEDIKKKDESFSNLVWSYVDYKPITGHWKTLEEVPTKTHISDKMSNDFKKMGFKFFGSTIAYSFMQAVGMVNDHVINCSVYKELSK